MSLLMHHYTQSYDEANNNNKNKNNNYGVDDKSIKIEFQDPNLRLGINSNKGMNNNPLPSQVMKSVADRFQLEDKECKNLDETEVIALRRKYLQNKARRERERATKLDLKIAILGEQSEDSNNGSGSSSKKKKTKRVSDQVLRMLVKSRATGKNNLKQQDRLYFQCFVLLDNDNDDDKTNAMSKEYRYFSSQDTFAKIANSFQNQHDYLSEVLCRKPAEIYCDVDDKDVNNNEKIGDRTSILTHRRFPVCMRIYEAISQGYLSEPSNNKIDTLIIRWYKDRDNATPSIIED